MRVVIATAFPADPEAPRGGVESVSVTLVRALAGPGDLDLHVVTLRRQELAVMTVPWQGATIHVLNQRGGHMLTSALGGDRRSLRSYIRDLAPDVVHAHDTYGLMVAGLPLPRVLTIHGFIHEDTRVSRTRFARIRAAAWRRAEHAAWADYPDIVSISPYVRERLTGIATGTIHDVDNPVDAAYFGVKREGAATVVLSAAVISRRKNTVGLVEAFARLPASCASATLRLAGAAREPAYHQRLVSHIASRNLQTRVAVLGSLGTAAVRTELSRAALFALVSLEENSPLGIQEAMAVGVPVVASNRCGMPYLIRNGETGFLVDPDDPDDIAEAMARTLADPAFGSAMGARAQQVAQERFHPDQVARRTRAIYDRAIRKSAPRSRSSRATHPS